MGTPFNLLSAEGARSLEEFSMAFAAALTQGAVPQWAKELGHYHPSKSIKTTFPVPVSAAGYHEFKDDAIYRDLFQKSFDIIPRDWQDGVSALARVIDAPDFVGWINEPAAIAAAAMSLANEWVATQLAANPVCWDGVTFFNDSHPVNVFDSSFGSYDNNLVVTAANMANGNIIDDAQLAFRTRMGANGKSLGLQLTHFLCGPNLEKSFQVLLERDQLVQTIQESSANVGGVVINNPFKARNIKLVVSDEMTSSTVFYALALNKPGMMPWVVQDSGAPEEIVHDRDSEMYKNKKRMGIGYFLDGWAELALPQCVSKYTISG